MLFRSLGLRWAQKFYSSLPAILIICTIIVSYTHSLPSHFSPFPVYIIDITKPLFASNTVPSTSQPYNCKLKAKCMYRRPSVQQSHFFAIGSQSAWREWTSEGVHRASTRDGMPQSFAFTQSSIRRTRTCVPQNR